MKVRDWFIVLEIIAKYKADGYDQAYIFGAEHDILYFDLSYDEVSEDSIDGKMLTSLGCHLADTGSWAKYVSF